MIDVVYSPIHEDHNPRGYLWHGNVVRYIESPDRVKSILSELSIRNMARLMECQEHPDEVITTAHDTIMINFLRNNTLDVIRYAQHPDVVLKGDDALHFSLGTYRAAKSSVDCALTGADIIASGRTNQIYSLCRPPGHHASKRHMGGFCFLNNAAIAAKALASKGRVAVLDIDKHHGNGTQDILFDEDDIMYLSLNAAGAYPIGLDDRQSQDVNNERIANFAVPVGTSNQGYVEFVEDAIDRARSQRAEFLVVSAGFDTSENEFSDLDDITTVRLTRDCFHLIGRKVRDSRMPVLVVQEGGYNTDSLGKDVTAFLVGME